MSDMTTLGVVVSSVVRVLMTVHQEDNAALAAVLGVGKQAVSDKLHGRVRWSIDDLEHMAQHYGIRSADFLRRPEELMISRNRAA